MKVDIPLRQGPLHPCAYLDDQEARLAYVDPRFALTPVLAAALIRTGFRRSGRLYYRPDCDLCRACVPLRIPVRDFAPNRSQRRAAARFAGLEAREMAPLFDEAHYRLYLRYQAARHPGGAMAQSSAEEYLDFLAHPDEGRTRFIEFRRSGLLLAVLVMDRLEEGASAVYTFFEPGPLGQGLGTYAVLWQIHWLLAQGLPYLYLGYWVKDSRTMGYKSGFRPYETLSDGVWLRGPSR